LDHKNEGFLKSAWHKLTHQHDILEADGDTTTNNNDSTKPSNKKQDPPPNQDEEPKKASGAG
jgi:molecular chaperone DnaJ